MPVRNMTKVIGVYVILMVRSHSQGSERRIINSKGRELLTHKGNSWNIFPLWKVLSAEGRLWFMGGAAWRKKSDTFVKENDTHTSQTHFSAAQKNHVKKRVEVETTSCSSTLCSHFTDSGEAKPQRKPSQRRSCWSCKVCETCALYTPMASLPQSYTEAMKWWRLVIDVKNSGHTR